MSVNYNTIKSMKGMAIGTIIPWSGPISGDFGIPKGWLACTSNRILNADEYPELYEIIGNRYGGFVSEGTFSLPSLPGKALVDYHPSHATELGYTGNFASFLGTDDDVANQNTTTQSSNIDVFLTLDAISGNMTATMTDMNINSSTYSTTFGYVPRRLGDGHMSSHGHGGTYPSVRTTNNRIEDCQNYGLTNCANIFNCSDQCEGFNIPRSGNSTNATDDFCVPKYDGGEHLGRGSIPYGTNGYLMARSDSPKNYINVNDDCLLYNETSATVGTGNDGAWQGIYATTLMTDIVNFETSAMSGHDHTTQSVRINTGNIATKETVRINTVSNGNIAPVNLDNQEVMTITANVNTPSMQMLFIIKAY
jgi:microcystin-dependent protein